LAISNGFVMNKPSDSIKEFVFLPVI
jgi:hypothetical protein